MKDSRVRSSFQFLIQDNFQDCIGKRKNLGLVFWVAVFAIHPHDKMRLGRKAQPRVTAQEISKQSSPAAGTTNDKNRWMDGENVRNCREQFRTLAGAWFDLLQKDQLSAPDAFAAWVASRSMMGGERQS